MAANGQTCVGGAGVAENVTAINVPAGVDAACARGTCAVAGDTVCAGGAVGESMSVVCSRFDDLGKDGSPARLGIMGGTFDPIHIGHLACAEQAREAFALDAVVFVPAGRPVYKKHQRVTDAQQRLEMCRLAVASNPAFDVSEMEIRRGGDTYTVDTLRELRAHYPDNVELFFITGADAVASIVRWRESRAMAGLSRFIAVTRPGYELGEEGKRALAQQSDFVIDYLEVTALAISSSDLRRRVSQGKSIRYLTMGRVNDYIANHGLYLREENDVCVGGADALADGADACLRRESLEGDAR